MGRSPSVAGSLKGVLSTLWSILKGMQVTIYYLFRPSTVVTVQYPRAKDPIPERHRGIHYLEAEKCVLCLACAKICPVDCVFIEGIRDADGILPGGTRGKKATLAQFAVDYTVCIFCGLCQEACPTGSIHLGPEFDYKAVDRDRMVKNLLTDDVYGDDDAVFLASARREIHRLKEEKRLAKERAKAEKAQKGKEEGS